ncbi:GAF domain-containing protein [Streptosporangium lutulentum]
MGRSRRSRTAAAQRLALAGRRRERRGTGAAVGEACADRPLRRWRRDRHVGARAGVNSAVGCPIVVEGRLWGALIVFRSIPGRSPRTARSA